MPTAIKIEDVTKSFKRGQPVLRDVSIAVERGEMVALIGASGSGKSTLIRLLAGLERLDRNAGRITMLGETVQSGGRLHAAQRRLRRDIGVVFQQFNLVGRLSLMHNVLAGRLGRTAAWRGTFSLFGKSDRVLALKALERVGMVSFARQRASQLSGGQQQRGAIARALAQEAKVILADEPIASLDPASAERVMDILSQINRQDGCTCLVSLHQIDHAFRHCHRIIALKEGEVVFDGPTDAVRREDLKALYGLDLGETSKANGLDLGETNKANGSAHAEDRHDGGDAAPVPPGTATIEAARAAQG